MKIKHLFTVFTTITVFLYACKKDEDTVTPAPSSSIQLILGAPQAVTDSSIRVKVTVRKTGNPTINSRGICWDSIAGVSIAKDTAKAALNNDSVFYLNMKGLIASKKYFVKAFASTSAGVTYSDEKIYYTLSSFGLKISSIQTTSTDATFSAVINNSGTINILAKGFCWSNSAMPEINSPNADTSLVTGSNFTSLVSGLAPANYHLRAYVTLSNNNTIYSADTVFTICAVPQLSLPVIKNLRNTSAIFTSNLTFSCNYTEAGFCWSTSNSNPKITNSTFSAAPVNVVNGNFRLSTGNLVSNTNYFICSYVKIGNTVEYSTVANLKTLPDINQPYATDPNELLSYIYEPGDPGFDSLVPHGLIRNNGAIINSVTFAPFDVNNGCIGISSNLTTSSSLGQGYNNTQIIAQDYDNVILNGGFTPCCPYGIGFCNYGNGWFMPSADELIKITANMMDGIVYWSSTMQTGFDLVYIVYNGTLLQPAVGACDYYSAMPVHYF